MCSSFLRSLALLLLLVVVPAVVYGADSEGLLRRAFEQYAHTTGLLSSGELLVSETPCGANRCLQFGLDRVAREDAVRLLPGLLGGFGFSGDVAELDMEVELEHYQFATVRVVVHPERNRQRNETLNQRVERVMALHQTVAGLSTGLTEAFRPSRIAPDASIYFIARFLVARSGDVMTVELLAPPQAAVPVPKQSPAPVVGCACTPEVSRGNPRTSGPFAGWNTFLLQCRWVCNGPTKPIE